MFFKSDPDSSRENFLFIMLMKLCTGSDPSVQTVSSELRWWSSLKRVMMGTA